MADHDRNGCRHLHPGPAHPDRDLSGRPAAPAQPGETRGSGMTTRVLIHDACIADGQSADLQVGVSLLIEGAHIAWIRPNDSADPTRAEVIDGGGGTVAPCLVGSPCP